jgi:hypothetical protein
MALLEERIIKQIDNLLELCDQVEKKGVSSALGRRIYAGTLGVVSGIYGTRSPQLEVLDEMNTRIMCTKWSEPSKNETLVEELKGILENVKVEIDGGLLKSIQEEARGEILADFVVLAKDAIDSGAKDVAAVLSCAALEDTLKRFAESVGIKEVDDKNMPEVINALKAVDAIPSAQAKIVRSFVEVRKKAMHAEWGKIDTSEVHSVIAFVQDFIAKHFTD